MKTGGGKRRRKRTHGRRNDEKKVLSFFFPFYLGSATTMKLKVEERWRGRKEDEKWEIPRSDRSRTNLRYLEKSRSPAFPVTTS